MPITAPSIGPDSIACMFWLMPNMAPSIGPSPIATIACKFWLPVDAALHEHHRHKLALVLPIDASDGLVLNCLDTMVGRAGGDGPPARLAR
jgi:hypothetical protein